MPPTWSHSLVRTKREEQVSGAQRRRGDAEISVKAEVGARGEDEGDEQEVRGAEDEDRMLVEPGGRAAGSVGGKQALHSEVADGGSTRGRVAVRRCGS